MKKSEEFFNEIKGVATVKDIEYLNGYFIFEMGNDSVVHFHVKECPGWKFGIWCESGEFFCQYEDTIDKFKPAASEFRCDINDISKVEEIIKYIHNDPIAAWSQEYFYGDKKSKARAWKEFIRYKFRRIRENIFTPLMDKNLIEYTKKLFWKENKECIEEFGWKVEVVDEGEYVSPRYEMRVELPDGFDKDYQDTGCYSMFEENSVYEKKWDKRVKFLKWLSDVLDIYWYRSIDKCVVFWNHKRIARCKW